MPNLINLVKITLQYKAIPAFLYAFESKGRANIELK